MTIAIHPLRDIEHLSSLAVLADSEGHEMVSRLVREWRSGANRFDQPGEAVLVATIAGQVEGVCGLNRDPFASDPRIGRVRRLYVAPAWRRMSIASALVQELLAGSRPWFNIVHVRTYDSSAIAFYRSLGFVHVVEDSACTLRRDIAAA